MASVGAGTARPRCSRRRCPPARNPEAGPANRYGAVSYDNAIATRARSRRSPLAPEPVATPVRHGGPKGSRVGSRPGAARSLTGRRDPGVRRAEPHPGGESGERDRIGQSRSALRLTGRQRGGVQSQGRVRRVGFSPLIGAESEKRAGHQGRNSTAERSRSVGHLDVRAAGDGPGRASPSHWNSLAQPSWAHRVVPAGRDHPNHPLRDHLAEP